MRNHINRCLLFTKLLEWLVLRADQSFLTVVARAEEFRPSPKVERVFLQPKTICCGGIANTNQLIIIAQQIISCDLWSACHHTLMMTDPGSVAK